MKNIVWFLIIALLGLPTHAVADEESSEIIRAANKAHGGEGNIQKIFTGSLHGKAKITFPPAPEITAEWDEFFELPRRYKRTINGEISGEKMSMEYVVSDKGGWIRRNGGEVQEKPPTKVTLEHSWHSVIAMLLTLLKEEYTLTNEGTVNSDGREMKAVYFKGGLGEGILHFDARTNLLAKTRKKMRNPFGGKEMDTEVVYADYKEVSAIKYPMKISSYADGKKVAELQIVKIEFVDKLDDKIFAKPK